MELWIPITIFAAFCQNARSAVQKHLKGQMSTTAATFVRFGYGMPFAMLYLALLLVVSDATLPGTTPKFFLAVILGSLAQIAATFLLVHLFSYRNFAVGTAYSKTEPIQAALLGLVLLGETLSWLMVGLIAIGVAGVIMISMARTTVGLKTLGSALFGRTALIGLASAALFGGSAAFYRMASLSLADGGFLIRAAFALAVATLIQTILMGGWMIYREPAELKKTALHWKASASVGLAGVLGSIGWFTAMTLQQVAYVRALAQIELVFTFAVSFFIFREALNRYELGGCILIIAAAVGIVLS